LLADTYKLNSKFNLVLIRASSNICSYILGRPFLTFFFRYFVFIPNNWKPENRKIRPVIFVHGLGLGLLQYLMFLTRLIRCLPEYPILVPIQAHISQDIFHPRFVSPMGRCETVKCLVGVLRSLGWVTKENDNNVPNEPAGVTMLSHSKFVSS